MLHYSNITAEILAAGTTQLQFWCFLCLGSLNVIHFMLLQNEDKRCTDKKCETLFDGVSSVFSQMKRTELDKLLPI